MYKVIKKFDFSAGHRLSENKGACRKLHGHNYVAEVTIVSNVLNSSGAVMDGGDINKIFQKSIGGKFAHRYILKKNDTYNEKVIGVLPVNDGSACWVEYNPTAENIAKDIYEIFQRELTISKKVKVLKVRLYETPTSYVEYSLDTSSF